MNYLIEKKVKNNIYIYEGISYWDKKTKKSRQKLKYIGRKDPITRETILKKSKSTPKTADEFGSKYFFEEVIKQLSIDELIKNSFPQLYQEILQVVLFQASESKPSYLMEYCNSNDEFSKHYSSQNLSILFKILGKMENEIQCFTKDWISLNKIQDSLFYDLTSISSYSKYADIVEWGYNRDGESLPQINFGILYGNTSKYPLLYKIYPGSINDVTTLKNIHTQLMVYGFKKFTFCLDRGFYSASNLSQIYKEDFELIMPMPFSTKNSEILINKDISSLKNMINLNGDTIYCDTFEIEIDDKKYFANIFINEGRKLRELDRFSKELAYIEENIANNSYNDEKLAYECVEKIPGIYKKYFLIENKENVYRIEKNFESMGDYVNKMGKIILITKSNNTKKKSIIKSYLLRDGVEKVFDVMKNEINENRLRVSSTESINGRLFINFLVLICISHVTKIMSSKDLFKKLTINELLMELKKLKIVTMHEGTKYLCEMTKKQKMIFDKFNIPYPKIET